MTVQPVPIRAEVDRQPDALPALHRELGAPRGMATHPARGSSCAPRRTGHKAEATCCVQTTRIQQHVKFSTTIHN